MTERIYRDPVHNIIRLRADVSEDRLLLNLVDAAEFQRLRRIKQLGLASYTYQGAEHSRFAHSLGVLHVMTRVLDKLGETHPLAPVQRLAVRAAALLHDIGHGAFSHVMEKILHFHHEDWTIAAILSAETEVGRLLHSYSAELPHQVAAVIAGRYQPAALAQLVSSQLDVDRMDYLLRDSLMTGAKYGLFDLAWVINALAIDPEHDHIFVKRAGLYAVEEYLQARYYMFRQVYFHRSLRSTEVVFKAVLQRALTLAREGREVWHGPGTAFAKVLAGNDLALTEHLAMDDSDVLFHVKQWQHSEDETLHDLSRRFINRRLFKALDLDMPENERADFVAAVRDCVTRAGFDPNYYFAEDRAGDVPYYYYTTAGASPKALIYVQDGYARPQMREISEVSAAIRGLQRGYELHRVCFPREVKEAVYALY